MRCQEVKNRLERHVDDELSGHERKAIEEHLSVCAACRKELEVLKSIDSVGKLKFYPEPQPKYWKQLTRSVRNRIAELADKPSESIIDLKRIRELIWPSRVSYRLVSLTATAVVLFFVIRLSFFHRGKYELPAGLTETKSVRPVEAETEPGEVQDAQHLAESMSGVKKTLKETGERPPLKEMKISEPSTPTIKSEEKQEPLIDETDKIAGGVVRSDKEAAPAGEGYESREMRPNFITPESIRVVSAEKPVMADKAGIISEDQHVEVAGVRAKSVAVGVVADEAMDEDVTYDLVYRRVENTENISERIQLWETYLRTNPESRFVKRVRYEQAQLYYMLAIQQMTEERINQALKFYRDHIDFITSEENVENVRKQMEELNTLSKKIEKK